MYKQVIFIVVLAQQLILANQDNSEKELRLHFDINKTIIAMDTVQGKGLEETINGILAEFTFAKWDGNHEQSYYAYITDRLAEQNPELSRSDEKFKTKRAVLLKDFSLYLKQYPALLMQYQDDKSCMLKILGDGEMVIFPSFFKVIAWLDIHYPNKYAIYLRTFGQDLPEVVPAIEKITSLRFAGQGEFQEKNLSLLGKEETLHDFFNGKNAQHYAIRDDYTYWKSQGFQAIGGKPFPLDIDNSNVISIFFDDNANDPDKPIIYPIGLDNRLEDIAELLKNGNVVAVNPKQAILDEDYFIKRILILLS